MNTSENQNIIFPKGERPSGDYVNYFVGTAWISTLVANDDTFTTVISNVTFEPGARNNWHSHPAGQILLITDGIGYYQEKGKSIQLIRKGDTIKILPNVVHWHGASPNRALTHIAININTEKGIATWLEKVTDDEYNSFK